MCIRDRGIGSNGRQYSAPSRSTARAGAQAHDHLGGIHSGSPGGAGGDRLFHGGGPHAARTGDLLRAVFHPSREPQGGHRPDQPWMQQMARNVTMEGCGTLRDCRYLLHDRDTKYTISFRAIIESGGVKPLALPARSPNLNAYAERWVRSVKDECLSKIILFGERSLRRALSEYVAHYHAERNHQGKSNVLLFRRVTETRRQEPVQCRDRLGGLLRYYHQEAA